MGYGIWDMMKIAVRDKYLPPIWSTRIISKQMTSQDPPGLDNLSRAPGLFFSRLVCTCWTRVFQSPLNSHIWKQLDMIKIAFRDKYLPPIYSTSGILKQMTSQDPPGLDSLSWAPGLLFIWACFYLLNKSILESPQFSCMKAMLTAQGSLRQVV